MVALQPFRKHWEPGGKSNRGGPSWLGKLTNTLFNIEQRSTRRYDPKIIFISIYNEHNSKIVWIKLDLEVCTSSFLCFFRFLLLTVTCWEKVQLLFQLHIKANGVKGGGFPNDFLQESHVHTHTFLFGLPLRWCILWNKPLHTIVSHCFAYSLVFYVWEIYIKIMLWSYRNFFR